MARKKKMSKRQKIFNVISNTIDLVQEYYLRGMFFMFVTLYVYAVFNADAIADIVFEMRYM
tara:strand:+ start:682 stop:864 length:183 start_codon:yes stop_codon:yes gene_type:complete